MNSVSVIINALSVEEKKNFLAELKKKNKRHDTKNMELFKLLESSPNIKNIDVVLYGKKAKGALHALNKRLYDSLVDFIAIKSFEGEQSEEMEVFKLLLAGRIFFEQKVFKVAFRVLKKAELKAKQYALYSVLNEIYYTRIQYAHLDKNVVLENLISDYKLNKQLLNQEENLNLTYAYIQNRLKNAEADIAKVVDSAFSKFNVSLENGLTYRSLYKILEINNQRANLDRNFYMLLPFVEKVNNEIELAEPLNEKYLFYHIQILYYVANTYFRNKKFTASSSYLDQMHQEMNKQNKKYYDRFLPQYTLLVVLNLNYNGNSAEAIKILEEFEYSKYKQQLNYVLDLKLMLVVLYFQQDRSKEALSLFKESTHSDQWYAQKAGIVWVVKKNLTEIMLYMELDDLDLVESKVKSFRKKHGAYLKSNKENRVLDFLSLATHFYFNKVEIDKELFMERIKKTLVKTDPVNEDLFVISFYAWLKARVMNTNLYQTTLQLITPNLSID